MAHSCPECGQACYCGGDIDDIFMEGTEEELGCTHCDGDDGEDYEEWGDDEDPDDRLPECAICSCIIGDEVGYGDTWDGRQVCDGCAGTRAESGGVN